MTLLGSTWGGVPPHEQQANTKSGVEFTSTVFEDPTQVFNYSLGEFFLKSRLTKFTWISCFSLQHHYYQENDINISPLNIQGGLWFGKRNLGPVPMQKPSNYHEAVTEEWSQGFCKSPKTGASAYSVFIQLFAECPQAGCRITGDPVDPLGLVETRHLLSPQCLCFLFTRVSTSTSESFPGEGKHESPCFLTSTLLFPVEYNIWHHSDLHSSQKPFCLPPFPSLLHQRGSPLPEQSVSLLLFYELRSWIAGGLCTVKDYRSSCAEQSLIPHLFHQSMALICAVTLLARSSGGEISDNSDPPLQSAPNAPNTGQGTND